MYFYIARYYTNIQEISDLSVGKIVVVETKRKNQIAFLKRLSDENGIPKVQVCTYTYMLIINCNCMRAASYITTIHNSIYMCVYMCIYFIYIFFLDFICIGHFSVR